MKVGLFAGNHVTDVTHVTHDRRKGNMVTLVTCFRGCNEKDDAGEGENA